MKRATKFFLLATLLLVMAVVFSVGIGAQTATSTPTPTLTSTPTPTTAATTGTVTPTPIQELLDSGFSLPTIVGIALAIILIAVSFALVF